MGIINMAGAVGRTNKLPLLYFLLLLVAAALLTSEDEVVAARTILPASTTTTTIPADGMIIWAASAAAAGSEEQQGGRRVLIGSRAPTMCTYNECQGCRHRCSPREVPVDAGDPMNSAYHYRCICHI